MYIYCLHAHTYNTGQKGISQTHFVLCIYMPFSVSYEKQIEHNVLLSLFTNLVTDTYIIFIHTYMKLFVETKTM